MRHDAFDAKTSHKLEGPLVCYIYLGENVCRVLRTKKKNNNYSLIRY